MKEWSSSLVSVIRTGSASFAHSFRLCASSGEKNACRFLPSTVSRDLRVSPAVGEWSRYFIVS